MEHAESQKELQLLPQYSVPSTSRNNVSSSRPHDSASKFRFRSALLSDQKTPSLDLQLSISMRPIRPVPLDCGFDEESRCIEALKWQAAEQIRLATMEKAYAERLRELTRKEMELAQSEFSRAQHMWERARQEVERAERMKERATRQVVDSTCMDVTCQSCRQRFKP